MANYLVHLGSRSVLVDAGTPGEAVSKAGDEHGSLVQTQTPEATYTFDIVGSTVAEVEGWIGDDKGRAQFALESELARTSGDVRSTLISAATDVLNEE